MKFPILFAIFLIFQGIEISNSFTINCDYWIYSLPIIGSVYECYTTNIPTSSGITVTNVTGTHLDGKNNNDVTSVQINGNWILSFVPRNFSNFFPNIKAILIYYTTIETLFGDEFDEFPQLEFLAFYYFNLTTISSKLFEKTPKMVYVDFGYNMIERVGHDLFTPLNVTQLQSVYFHNNRCINRYVQNGNTTAIISLINELREKCPFNDEFPSTTTTTSLTTTTIKNLFCTNESIEDFVCDLKDSMIEVQQNLVTKDEKIEGLENKLLELQAQIQIKDQKIEEIQSESREKFENVESRMQWLEEELLRLTTHPCACK
ncbi:hypothetical protein PVAND_008733 [Polypedilum vanderplanki]|uniref:Uncharacterized protein n=1 Tax=Polypedilum vanderplanki TaxID=319348 RepID=A0A9J6CB56_POLVA|nr:hypothetical protein PVAND_008733 [Polypedilum vanderplanki]